MKTQYYDIKAVIFDLISRETCDKQKYIFVDGHPVDTRAKKYKKYRRLFRKHELKCKCCGAEPKGFRFIPCVSDGWLHEESGRRKYTFMLVDENNKPMTFDHWIPQWFLRKEKLRSKKENFVLMCRRCNEFKGKMVPENWEEIYKRMK